MANRVGAGMRWRVEAVLGLAAGAAAALSAWERHRAVAGARG